ncbi:MAG TPA: GNAT family N-acetyltransferase [Anaerolineales bacterium]
MQITIREIDKDILQDVNKCDGTFTVDSKLVLHAENGIIRYSVVSVEPYEKQYIFEEKDYPSCISNPNKTIYFAYVNGQLAGQTDVIKYWNTYARIDDFIVDVRFRRRGVGHALMQRVVDWAKARQLPGIMLETQNNNVAACRFYENFGFRLRGFDTYLYSGMNPSTDEIALYWYFVF